MKIHNLISERKSIRAFSEKSISDEELVTLLEAARWAPSSMNEQPWRFIVARKENSETFERMLECLNESNKNWAQHAAALILTVASKTITSLNKSNSYAWHDVGLAIGNLSIQATSMDIYLHQMGGFKHDLAKNLFEIPNDFEPVSIIALGYKGNPDLLPSPLREREMSLRKRKPLSELVFVNHFGEKSSLFS
jgi:nitroreductase